MPEKIDPSLSLLLSSRAKLRPSTDEGELPEKQCTKCGDWLPADLEFFYSTHLKTEAGYFVRLRGWCKACAQECSKEYREAHPYQPRFEIVRRRRRSGTLVIVTYNGGRHYAAFYPAGSDISRSAIYRDLRERGCSKAKDAHFKPFNLQAGRFVLEIERERRRFSAPIRRGPNAHHPWRLANDASYRLYQARAEARRGKAGA